MLRPMLAIVAALYAFSAQAQPAVEGAGPAASFELLYAEALEKAEEDANRYDNELGMWVYARHLSIYDTCIGKHTAAAALPSRGVVVVGQAGRIVRYIFERDNAFTQCLARYFEGKVAPEPPTANFPNPANWEGTDNLSG